MTLYYRARSAFKRAHGYGYEGRIEHQKWVEGYMTGYESAQRKAKRAARLPRATVQP